MMIWQRCFIGFRCEMGMQANVFTPVFGVCDGQRTQFARKRAKKTPESLGAHGTPGVGWFGLFPLVADIFDFSECSARLVLF